jgi:hypothetical protein
MGQLGSSARGSRWIWLTSAGIHCSDAEIVRVDEQNPG